MTHSLHITPLDLTTLMVDDLPPVSDKEKASMSTFLQCDKWTVKEAMCLLCRIDPHFSDINWSDQRNSGNPNVTTATIKSYQPFQEDQPIFAMPDVSDTRYDSDKTVNDKQIKLKDAESALFNLRKIWDSGLHSKEGYTPEYFIDWAIEKDHDIGWLEWALKSARYTHPLNRGTAKDKKSNNIDSDQLAPKSKTTALKIIGGLLMSTYGMDIHGRLTSLGEVIKDLDRVGVVINEQTLRTWAKEAARIIPQPPKN